MCWTYFETIRHIFKNVSPSQKTIRPPGVPSWLRAWPQLTFSYRHPQVVPPQQYASVQPKYMLQSLSSYMVLGRRATMGGHVGHLLPGNFQNIA